MELTFFTLMLFVLLGAGAGFLAGLLGIGGGIILVPLFLYTFPLAGFPAQIVVHAAFATSLAVIIPTAVSSTLGHRKRGNVDWHQVFFLGVGGMIGAVMGSTLAVGIGGDQLKILFGLMQIAVALKMISSPEQLPEVERREHALWKFVLVGMAGGCFSAFFGVGGGIVAVPLMVIALRLPIHLAVGNSSALIVLSAISGVLAYIWHGWDVAMPAYSLGFVSQPVALIVAPFSILFARLGVRVAGRSAHARLIKVFSGLLIIIGLQMILGRYFQ
ncbi:MAG: sulfite exporter TauE/SafE family protein [Desulfuromonadales bacterium]|nr:sulfite exporter TauE/SafE family protein [Desulfuromonadales bacterium]